MKKIYLLAALLLFGAGVQAQDTYLNDRMTNNSGDLHGTARFVGMGGAMGALGSDMSVISWNPAGIGMMQRNDVALSVGVNWNQKPADGYDKATFTLEQFGIVFALPCAESSELRNINFGVNYQLKKNFNNSFMTSGRLNGLSQMDQCCAILNAFGTGDDFGMYPNLSSTAGEFYYEDQYDPSKDYSFLDYNENRKYKFANSCRGEGYEYIQHTWGTLQGFDFNLSGNVRDRLYWGITVGMDNLHYAMDNEYFEQNSNPATQYAGDYTVFGSQTVNGFGLNAKVGITVRPIEYNPFRFFLAIETPTAYSLKSRSSVQIVDQTNGNYTNPIDGIYRYNMSTPAKVRLGLGSTIGSHFAFDVDYEFANYSKARMKQPTYDYDDDTQTSLFKGKSDADMNCMTADNLKATHTLRAGIEARVDKNLSFRLGYNFVSSAYKDNLSFSQLGESPALNATIGTHFLGMGSQQAITLGMGYRWKRFYADLAYKIHAQKADFYAFDEGDAIEGMKQAGYTMPVGSNEVSEVTLSRHQLNATFGIKF